jgi:hypothetical protein
MGSSVPWSGGRRDSIAYHDVSAAAAAVFTSPIELTRQHAFSVYISSVAAGSDWAEAALAFLAELRPHSTRHRSHTKDCLKRQHR